MANVVRILLLGKTGVGKSSFINYFLGKDVAAVGAGRPCTQELTKYVLNEWPDTSIELYDSKGLEVKDADNWTQQIIKELEEKSRLDFTERYHTIFYCISAQKKIESYEEKTLKELQKAADQPIHVILTHCDNMADDKLEERERCLKEKISKTLCIYRITSIDKTKRGGTTIKKSGREEVVDGVFNLLWQDVISIMADKVAEDVVSQVEYAVCQIISYFANFINDNFSIIGLGKMFGKSVINNDDSEMDDIFSNMDDVTDKYINDVKKNSENIIPKHLEPMKKIYNSYSQIAKSIDLMDEETLVDICLDIVGSKIEEIGETYTDEYFEKKVRAVHLLEEADGDDTSLLGTLKMIKALGIGVATVKKDFLKMIADMRSDIYFNLFDDKQLYNSIKDEIIEKCAYKRG